jgi:cytochrome c oxidase assembly factor CtaG
MSLAAGTPYSWSFEPAVMAWLALAAGLYGRRFRALHPSGRPSVEATAADYGRALAFGAGLIVIGLALMSPLDSLGEERLFSVHMAQHLLLMDVAPILLLLGLSRRIMRPLVRRLRPLEQALGYAAHPITVLALMVVVIWVWHLPALYDLALEHPWAHGLEHLAFFAVGLAFWWYVIEPVPPRHRLEGMGTIAYVAGAKLLLGLLGLVLAFSPSAFYDFYQQAPRTWGLSPLEDQNVGGLVMMLEQTLVLATFFAILFAGMIERSEQAQRRRERLGV